MNISGWQPEAVVPLPEILSDQLLTVQVPTDPLGLQACPLVFLNPSVRAAFSLHPCPLECAPSIDALLLPLFLLYHFCSVFEDCAPVTDLSVSMPLVTLPTRLP